MDTLTRMAVALSALMLGIAEDNFFGSDGGGHAIGIIKKSTGFLFLDVNEGLTRLADRNALWRFLYDCVTDDVQGIAREYPQFCMGYWT